MQFTEQLVALQEAVRTLQEENQRLQAENATLRMELDAAQQRLAELEQKKAPPPALVKATVPARPKKERKKRAPQYNRARRLEPPTQVVEHRLDCYPHCAGRLSSLILARRRHVIELPAPPR